MKPPRLTKISSPGSRLRRRAFSLVEVVVAIGIFALALASVVGLVAAVTKRVNEVSESDDASRLLVNLQAKLQAVSFTAIRAYINLAPISNIPADDRIYASRDGSLLGRGDQTAVWNVNGTAGIQAEEDALKYFLVEMRPNDALSPPGNDATAGYLAFTVRLIYPAYLGDGTPVTDSSQQSILVMPVAVTR
jgi:type II secretory pathway pseudopilin PulG